MRLLTAASEPGGPTERNARRLGFDFATNSKGSNEGAEGSHHERIPRLNQAKPLNSCVCARRVEVDPACEYD